MRRCPAFVRVVLSRGRGERNLRVFAPQDKQVYVQVVSDAAGLVLSGTYVDPRGKRMPLEFDQMMASFPLMGEGSYSLTVHAEAKGYKPLTKEVIFGVTKARPVFGRLDGLKEKAKTRRKH